MCKKKNCFLQYIFKKTLLVLSAYFWRVRFSYLSERLLYSLHKAEISTKEVFHFSCFLNSFYFSFFDSGCCFTETGPVRGRCYKAGEIQKTSPYFVSLDVFWIKRLGIVRIHKLRSQHVSESFIEILR